MHGVLISARAMMKNVFTAGHPWCHGGHNGLADLPDETLPEHMRVAKTDTLASPSIVGHNRNLCGKILPADYKYVQRKAYIKYSRALSKWH